MPLTASVVVAVVVLAVMVTELLSAPLLVGLKVTVSTQLAPEARPVVRGQLSVSE